MSFAALGGVAGFLAGLLGVGGGVVLVPGIYFLMTFLGYESDVLMHVAVGTSLAVIIPTGFSSARAHWKKKAVDLALVKQIGIGIFIGVIAGTALAHMLAGETLKIVFATALVFLAAIMVANPARFSRIEMMPKQPVPAFVGSGIGALSTLIGVGGATMNVPFMSMCKVPLHRAIGTAAALGLVISVPAALGFIWIGLDVDSRPPLSLGFVNIAAWLLIIPTSVLIAPLGAKAAHTMPVNVLRRVFAGFMIVIAIKIWHGIIVG